MSLRVNSGTSSRVSGAEGLSPGSKRHREETRGREKDRLFAQGVVPSALVHATAMATRPIGIRATAHLEMSERPTQPRQEMGTEEQVSLQEAGNAQLEGGRCTPAPASS